MVCLRYDGTHDHLARMFAGLFTGGIFVSFLTYIVNKSDPEDQGKYLTYSATIKSVASAFGYMIGGFLGEFSVRLAFLVQAGTLIAVQLLSSLSVNRTARRI